MRKLAFMAALIAIMLFTLTQAIAAPIVTAAVQVKASRSVYDSLIRAGEDVDMTVSIDGFLPTACQWYREGEPIDGANGLTLHISAAQVSDTGIYRMDAMDESGRVRVSADVALRVVDSTSPKMGDTRLPVPTLLGMLAIASAAGIIAFVRKPVLHR